MRRVVTATDRRSALSGGGDTIDLLGIVLGTGLSLAHALVRVSEEMQHIYPELASEFYTVVMQVKAGQERSKAFQQLVRLEQPEAQEQYPHRRPQ